MRGGARAGRGAARPALRATTPAGTIQGITPLGQIENLKFINLSSWSGTAIIIDMGLEEEIHKINQEIKEKEDMYETIEREFEALDLRRALLRAELAGLEQRRRSLADASARAGVSGSDARSRQGSGAGEITKLTLVDAVIEVVNESDQALRIDEVVHRLRESGRDDNAASVSVTLHYAMTNGKIRRVSRGVYGRALVEEP